MSKEAISYLNENKNKFSKEKLIESLRKSGYEVGDIAASVKEVYGEEELIASNMGAGRKAKNFWDFSAVYEYGSLGEKIVDYILGFILPGISAWLIAEMIDDDLVWIVGVAYIAALVYFKNRRHYLFRGLILNIYLFLAAIGLGLLFFGFGMGSYYF